MQNSLKRLLLSIEHLSVAAWKAIFSCSFLYIIKNILTRSNLVLKTLLCLLDRHLCTCRFCLYNAFYRCYALFILVEDYLYYRQLPHVKKCCYPAWNWSHMHCVKNIQIFYFWSIFYSINLGRQSEYRKIWTRKKIRIRTLFTHDGN